MPYVDLVCSDDYASLFYYTSASSGTIGSLDPDKPTIVMLHPIGLDSTWMHPQLDDPRIIEDYNVVVFDTRISGRSRSRFSGRHDLWVDAADLAHAFYHLHLAPAHIFANDNSTCTALRFASLFPELCLSLTLCNVPPQTESKHGVDALQELAHMWGYAEDMESFEHACKEMLSYYAGPHAHPDIQDEIVAFWCKNYPPFRRSLLIANVHPGINRIPMTPAELASITAPVLIIQSEQSSMYPMASVEQLIQGLVSVPGGAMLFPVKAAKEGFLCLIRSSIVNQVFAKFLSRQHYARSDLFPPRRPLKAVMADALERLSRCRGDPSILSRDPVSPLSFSCVTPEVCKRQAEELALWGQGQCSAFSPLSPDGRPIRKYSERQDHWLDADMDGFSYLDSKTIREAHRYVKSSNGHGDSIDLSPSEIQHLSRNHKSPLTPTTIEKHVIKGTMAKVVASSTQRILR